MAGYAERVLNDLKVRYAHEPEFIQAATEILTTLKPVIDKNEAKYEAAGKIEQIIAAAENNATTVSFPSTENLLFCVENGKLRIAAASGDVWIIAELEPKNAAGDMTETFGPDGEPSTLTISSVGTKSVDVTTYKLVDQQTALDYVEATKASTTPESTDPTATTEPVGGAGQ